MLHHSPLYWKFVSNLNLPGVSVWHPSDWAISKLVLYLGAIRRLLFRFYYCSVLNFTLSKLLNPPRNTSSTVRVGPTPIKANSWCWAWTHTQNWCIWIEPCSGKNCLTTVKSGSLCWLTWYGSCQGRESFRLLPLSSRDVGTSPTPSHQCYNHQK